MENFDAFRLDVQELVCLRGQSLIFTDISLELSSGQAIVLRGPNGSGKSSLLRSIAGLIQPFSGFVRCYAGDLQSQDDKNSDDDVSDYISYIGHDNPIKAPLTIRENIEIWAGLFGVKDESRIDHALSAMDLETIAHLSGRVLSSGQRRRLT
ncbi:MAG: ATP-binding cassette domain-containing protein, partial [Alphaproteobacteria bacterium]|nr:ATP-binding cassette domain-containing protein [Alphaproteobacteria bacterium]